MSRILYTFELSTAGMRDFLGDEVTYRPDLQFKNGNAWKQAVFVVRPDIVIAQLEHWDRLKAWMEDHPKAAIILVENGQISQQTEATEIVPSRVWKMVLCDLQQAEGDIFALAEEICNEQLIAAPSPVVEAPRFEASVAMVGAGIVNLVTALALHEQGYRVEIFDKCPDPLSEAGNWKDHGATFGGLDGRIFSFNESRHHHASVVPYNTETNTQFQKAIADGGWLSNSAGNFGANGRSWIAAFEKVPPWLARRYDRDIIGFNQSSFVDWTAMKRRYPEIFKSVGFTEPLYRIYQKQMIFDAALKRERAIGSIIREIPLDEMTKIEPSLEWAIKKGAVVGALQVQGFSLNIHRFARKIVVLLMEQGVVFHWNRQLTAVLRTPEGRVTALQVGADRIVADHYVFSLGAYGQGVAGLERLQQQIACVMGMWLTVPNTQPALTAPLKVSRRAFASDGAAEGANIIPAIDGEGNAVLHCSSGHGFLGDVPTPSDLSRRELVRCLHETVQELFPQSYSSAGERGMLDAEPRYCIRPWTPSGLGLFSMEKTVEGGCAVFTGGHNTGGFAQSPAVAKAVMDALRNDECQSAPNIDPFCLSNFDPPML